MNILVLLPQLCACFLALNARINPSLDFYPDYVYPDNQRPEAPPQNLEDPDPSGPISEEWDSNEVKLGEVSGIGVDSNGDVHVFHRGSRHWTDDSFDDNNVFKAQKNPIKEATHLKIDKETGKVVSERGENEFFMPHGLSVDHEDNIWLTDVARHQVFKYSPDGKLMLTLGENFVPGDDSSHFCKPTDVAVSSSGVFFVSDGYCNSRVMKFTADGTYISSFGQPNKDAEALPGMFNIPHSLTLIEDWNLICVADRENRRIQCFSAGLIDLEKKALPTGTFIREASNLGRIFAIRNMDHYLVGVTQGPSKNQVFVVNLENGQPTTFEAGLENPHALAVTGDGTIYVGEMNPNRIVKILM